MFTGIRTAAVGSVLAIGMVVAGLAQSSQPINSAQGRPAATGASAGDLLAEVRALRAEINEAARAGLRAQLLGMRLQLQEQRIGVVARQLSDVQDRLRANQTAKGSLSAGLKMFEANKEPDGKPDGKDELDHIFAPLRSQLGALEKSDEQLRAEEMNLSQLIAQEQSRWSSFNAQIEEMERAVMKSVR